MITGRFKKLARNQKLYCSIKMYFNPKFLEVTSPSFSVTVAKQKKKKKGIFFLSCQRWRQIYSIMHCLSALVDTTKTCGRLLLLIIDNSTVQCLAYEKQRAKIMGKNQLLGVSTKVSKSQLHKSSFTAETSHIQLVQYFSQQSCS